MKKTWMMVFVLMVAACASKTEEQKFVNPIFYQVMNPVSTGTWYTQITPTEMLRSNKGTDLKQKCTLIENTMEAVTLQCEGAYEPQDVLQFRFVPDLDIKGYRGTFVWMYDKGVNEKKFLSHESLVIY